MPPKDPWSLGLQSLVRQHLIDAKPGDRMLMHHLRGMAFYVWFSRHYTADDVVRCVAERTRFGHETQGFRAAARLFYDKMIAALDPHEVALLLAVVESPNRNDPWCDSERARRSRSRILEKLREAQVIDKDALDQAMRRDLGVVPRICGADGVSS